MQGSLRGDCSARLRPLKHPTDAEAVVGAHGVAMHPDDSGVLQIAAVPNSAQVVTCSRCGSLMGPELLFGESRVALLLWRCRTGHVSDMLPLPDSLSENVKVPHLQR